MSVDLYYNTGNSESIHEKVQIIMSILSKLFTCLITLNFMVVSGVVHATTYNVSPGMVIQETLDKAEPGDVIQILPGEYIGAIKITTPNLQVLGMMFEGEHALMTGFDKGLVSQLSNPIVIEADDVVVEGLHVRKFDGAAIVIKGRRNITLRDLDISTNYGNAITVEDSNEITIEGCTVRSAGYVGLSLRGCGGVTVSRLEAYNNAIGLEVQDGVKIMFDQLSLHDNAMGALFLNSKSDQGNADNITISSSRILNNTQAKVYKNLPETAYFMPGVGIRMVGTSTCVVTRCHIEGNSTYGVMTEQAAHVEGMKPYPAEFTYVHHNEYANNGMNPSEEFKATKAEIPPGDIYWDEEGRRNQFQEEGLPTTFPKKLITKFGGVHTGGFHFI